MIEIQRVDFIAVPTQDLERADRFYGETLGIPRNPNSTESWIEYETENVTLGLVQPEIVGMPFVPLPFASIVFRVPAVDTARAKLEDAGVEFTMATFDSGVCNGAAFTDPDGNGLMLHRRYAPYGDGSTP